MRPQRFKRIFRIFTAVLREEMQNASPTKFALLVAAFAFLLFH